MLFQAFSTGLRLAIKSSFMNYVAMEFSQPLQRENAHCWTIDPILIVSQSSKSNWFDFL